MPSGRAGVALLHLLARWLIERIDEQVAAHILRLVTVGIPRNQCPRLVARLVEPAQVHERLDDDPVALGGVGLPPKRRLASRARSSDCWGAVSTIGRSIAISAGSVAAGGGGTAGAGGRATRAGAGEAGAGGIDGTRGAAPLSVFDSASDGGGAAGGRDGQTLHNRTNAPATATMTTASAALPLVPPVT